VKLKDIKVGDRYAVGTDENNRCAEVLEVGVHASVYASGAFTSYRSERAIYVRVQYVGGCYERTEHARSVLRPWAEQEPLNVARDERGRARQALRERQRGFAALADAFPTADDPEKAVMELVDLVRSIENDDGKIPGWLWDRIRATLAPFEEGAS
jgi:hypothetical protein